MNDNVLIFELISPCSTESHKVAWLQAETPTGNFTLCVGHAPLASLLKKKSQLTYQSLEGEVFIVKITSGFIILSDRTATVFID